MTTAIETKERPILFSGEMVRAILEGRKTVTRRIGPGEYREGDSWGNRGGGAWEPFDKNELANH